VFARISRRCMFRSESLIEVPFIVFWSHKHEHGVVEKWNIASYRENTQMWLATSNVFELFTRNQIPRFLKLHYCLGRKSSNIEYMYLKVTRIVWKMYKQGYTDLKDWKIMCFNHAEIDKCLDDCQAALFGKRLNNVYIVWFLGQFFWIAVLCWAPLLL